MDDIFSEQYATVIQTSMNALLQVESVQTVDVSTSWAVTSASVTLALNLLHAKHLVKVHLLTYLLTFCTEPFGVN